MESNLITQATLAIAIKATNIKSGILESQEEYSNLMLEIGSSMRSLRKQRGLTIKELAKRLEIHNGTLSQMERGNRPYTQAWVRRAFEKLGIKA